MEKGTKNSKILDVIDDCETKCDDYVNESQVTKSIQQLNSLLMHFK